MRPTGSRLVLAAVLALVFLAGCGGDDDSSSSPSSTSPSATSTVVELTTTAPAAIPTTVSRPRTTASQSPSPVSCPDIGFTENSDNVASDVTATGLSCEEAEAFIRAASETLNAIGPASADLEGFHCVRTATEDFGLPSSTYACTAGARKVTFVRT